MARVGKRRPVRHVHNDNGDPSKHPCWRLGCGHTRGKHKDGPCKGLHYDPFGPVTACVCEGFVEAPANPPPVHDDKGDVISMRARWNGAPPQVGEYLASSGGNTRFAYKILSLYKPAKSDVYEISALKIPLGNMPAGAVVHQWKWDARGSKGNGDKGTAWGKT